MAELDRASIEQAFEELGERLRRQRLIGEIAVYGGAAMVLHYHVDRATQDVDAIIEREHGPVQQAAREIGRLHGWGESWLNENVSVYLSNFTQQEDMTLFRSYPSEGAMGLRVYVASPRYMLAMKIAALRVSPETHDVDDALQLARIAGVITTEALIALHRLYFPDRPLDGRKIVVVDEIVERLHAPPHSS